MTGSLPPQGDNPPPLWRAFGVYTASRVALFVAFVALTYAAGLRGVIVLVIALVLSSVASYFVLARQRAAFSLALERHVEHRRGRASSRAAREDAIADRIAQEQQERSPEVG